jgi:hypothetical protein
VTQFEVCGADAAVDAGIYGDGGALMALENMRESKFSTPLGAMLLFGGASLLF